MTTLIPASSNNLSNREDELPSLPIWTFSLGVLALLTLGLTSIPAIVCGHRALAQTKAMNHASLARFATIVGLAIGYLGVAVFAFCIVTIFRLWISS